MVSWLVCDDRYLPIHRTVMVQKGHPHCEDAARQEIRARVEEDSTVYVVRSEGSAGTVHYITYDAWLARSSTSTHPSRRISLLSHMLSIIQCPRARGDAEYRSLPRVELYHLAR